MTETNTQSPNYPQHYDNIDVHQYTPAELINPILFSDENYNYAKQAYRQLQQDLKPQPSDPKFLLENLQQLPEHKWLKKCQAILYSKDANKTDEECLNELHAILKRDAAIVKDEVSIKQPKPYIALDLETTGLNRSIKKIGGRNEIFIEIVGVCLAPANNIGYYIPVKHTETDNHKNFSLKPILSFLQTLLNEFHVIYHNAVYDQEVLALNGILLDNKTQTFSDTMLLANLLGWKQRLRQVGLKFLSEQILNRKMLEIKDIAGTKTSPRLQTLPATNTYVYGASDAMNTLALFNHIINSKENPYELQKNRTLLEHKVVSSVRSTFRCGLPVNYSMTMAGLRTIVRRIIMLENIFYDNVSDQSVEINSAEKCGTHIYKLLKQQFENKYCPEHVLQNGEKGFTVLVKKLEQDFEMTVKTKELKAGLKISATLPEETIYGLYNNLAKWDFVSDQVKDEIWTMCDVLSEYRSLQQRINIVISFIRDGFNDDFNLNRCPIELKLSGTDTGRFSNSGSSNGAFDHIGIFVKKTKTDTGYIEGHGTSSFNSQGLSHDVGRVKKLKRVKNINQLSPEIAKANKDFDRIIDGYIHHLFIEG